MDFEKTVIDCILNAEDEIEDAIQHKDEISFHTAVGRLQALCDLGVCFDHSKFDFWNVRNSISASIDRFYGKGD